MRFLISTHKRILLFLVKNDTIASWLFNLKLLFLGRKKSDLLILATITKTGTHYVRFLLAYYLKMRDLKEKSQDYDIESDDFIVDDYFSNSWHTSYTFITRLRPSTDKLTLLDLLDFPRSHMAFRKKSWKNTKILHTYRDLKDQAFVSFKMKYECDAHLNKEYENVDELYRAKFEENSSQYESFRQQRTNHSNSLRIEFEQIVNHPSDVLALIIQWLGHEPDTELCAKAAKLCQQTPSILVGGGEKWHRMKRDDINYHLLNQFIQNNAATGAIGTGKASISYVPKKAGTR